ncbi:MAG: hypothetical protein ACOC3J_07210 [Gemmatimonadota bacterium]
MSKLPTEHRPIRMDPELATAVEAALEPYSGKDLEKAQKAVLGVYQSANPGSHADLVEQYSAAIAEAVEGK